jgi:hypothetical protein
MVMVSVSCNCFKLKVVDGLDVEIDTSGNAVSVRRNNEPNMGSSSITGPSSDMSSGSRP